MNKEDEVVCYIILRRDLNMSTGKSVAQGGHALQYMLAEVNDYYDQCELFNDKPDMPEFKSWIDEWQASNVKVVLGVDSEQELDNLCKQVSDAGYIINWVIDEGRTEVAPDSLTAACIQPMPRKIAKPFVGHLRLL